jgi:hypothetical protein
MFNLKKKLGIAVLLILGLVASSQADIILDDFDYSDDVNLTVSSSLTTATTKREDINALGGDVIYTLTHNDGPDQASARTVDYMGEQYLTWANGSNTNSTLSLFYTGTNGTPSGPLDLTAGGKQNAFYYDVLASDGNFNVSIFVGSGGFNSGTGQSNDESVYSVSSGAITALTRSTLNFSDFNAVLGSGANFSSVDYVHVLLLTTTGSVDLDIAEFGTVLEPSSLAIFGLGLIGLAFVARKKS